VGLRGLYQNPNAGFAKIANQSTASITVNPAFAHQGQPPAVIGVISCSGDLPKSSGELVEGSGIGVLTGTIGKTASHRHLIKV